MEDKITIIEGPPPTFEVVREGWVLGLFESPSLGEVAVTHLRTFNGPALVERCHRAWRNQMPIQLEYRTSDGLQKTAPIVAVRHVEVEDGHLLVIWVRMEGEGIEIEMEYGDDDDDDIDDTDDDDELDSAEDEDPFEPPSWR